MSNGQFITADIEKKIEGSNLTVMGSHAAFKLFMDEEFVDLSKDVQEQPWCSVCMEFSDYRRKWQSLPRADLEGGTYSENTESPYCVGCGSLMYDLKDSRNLLFSIRILSLFFMTVVTLICFFLFTSSLGGLFCWFCCLVATWAFLHLPVNSRKAIKTFKKYQKEKLILDTQTSIRKNLMKSSQVRKTQLQ